MNDFPLWWDSTVTIFNKYVDDQTQIVTWYKTTLDNCFWKNIGTKVNVGDVVIDTFSVVCRIPKNDLFKPSGTWVTSDRAKYFTLAQGDIIVFGDCPDVIDEYTKGSRSSDILTKYHKSDTCMEIKNVSYNTMRGMINPHYLVRGL